MANNLCILICEAFEREAKVILQAENLKNVSVITYPTSMFHIRTGWEGVVSQIRSKKDACQIMLLGGGCIVGLGNPPEELHECYYHQLNKCFDMLLNKPIIDVYIKQGAYLLSPSWVRNWRERMAEYNFDREKAQEFFTNSKTKLVLLDTGVFEDSLGYLEEFAEFVGLPYEVLPIGLDFFKLFLKELILEWQLKEVTNIKNNNVENLLTSYEIDAEPSIREAEDRAKVLLLYMVWNDKKGPYLEESFPRNVEFKIPIDKVGFQLFSGVESIYGQEKMHEAQGVLLNVDNIQRQGYIYFDSIIDPTARGRQRPFMLAIVAPKINYFESLKIKEIFKTLAEKIKAELEWDVQNYWKRIAQILATPVI